MTTILIIWIATCTLLLLYGFTGLHYKKQQIRLKQQQKDIDKRQKDLDKQKARIIKSWESIEDYIDKYGLPNKLKKR